MERHAVRVEPEIAGALQQPDRHLRGAAEFPRQRPVRAFARHQDTAENARARRLTRELLQLRLAVKREQPHALCEGEGDVPLLLNRVAVGQPFRGGAVAETQTDFSRARDIEIRAPRRQHRDDLRRRVGLDRVEHAGHRQIPGQEVVCLGDYVEIDDEARRLGGMGGQETGDLVVHVLGHLPKSSGRIVTERRRPPRSVAPAGWRSKSPPAPQITEPRTQREQDGSALNGRPSGRLAQLRLLGSETRPPRPRWRVPRNAASGQGTAALIGIATISTSLSGPAPSRQTGGPDCQKGRVTSLHNHHGP